MIPEDKKAAVKRALQAAFGVTEFEDIRQLTEGLSSALIFRIVVREQPYLLRVITRTDAMGDPTRLYSYMKAGEDAGLAPRVWYTSIEDRVSITDFVNAKPFPKAIALEKLPETIRKLHALPPFPRTANSRGNGRIHFEIAGGEDFAGERNGGRFRALRAGAGRVSAGRCGNGIEPQRFETGECIVRW
jgi:hypothetical protein